MHDDFRYVPETEFSQTSHGPLPITPEAKALRKGNEIARQAATLCWRIRHEEPDPKKWAPLIAAAPEEVRECLRAYLVQAYAELRHKARGKRSVTADTELAKMGEIARRL